MRSLKKVVVLATSLAVIAAMLAVSPSPAGAEPTEQFFLGTTTYDENFLQIHSTDTFVLRAAEPSGHVASITVDTDESSPNAIEFPFFGPVLVNPGADLVLTWDPVPGWRVVGAQCVDSMFGFVPPGPGQYELVTDLSGEIVAVSVPDSGDVAGCLLMNQVVPPPPPDTTPPTITITTPTPGDGDVYWEGEDVYADFVCEDSESGVASCEGFNDSTLLSGDPLFTAYPGTYALSVDAFDNTGNGSGTPPVFYTVEPDLIPPTVNITTPEDNAEFEVGEEVLAAYTCDDFETGIVNCDGTVAVGEEIYTATPGTFSFYVFSWDGADAINLTEVTHTYTVVPPSDTTPPTVDIATPAPGTEFEVGEEVFADYTCSDTESGIASCVGTIPDGLAVDTTTTGSFSLTVTGIDNAGNPTVATRSYTVEDSTTPTATITTPANGATYGIGDIVTADFSCGDTGPLIPSCVGTIDDELPVPTSTEGVFTFSVTATDVAGNTSTTDVTYTVGDAPVTTLTITGTPGNEGWYVTPVDLSFDATDTGSGVAGITVGLTPIFFPGDNVTFPGLSLQGQFMIPFFATDNVGVVEAVQTTNFKVDSVAPSADISSPVDDAEYEIGEVVTPVVACDDDPAGSGLSSCDAPAAVDTSVPGSFTFTLIATDVAGNVTEVVHSYTVGDTTAPVTTAVVTGDGDNGWYRSSVTVELTSTDIGSAGVDSITYRLNGTETTVPGNSTSVVIEAGYSAQGTNTLVFSAVDAEGNQELDQTLEIKIDSISPYANVAFPYWDAVYPQHATIAVGFACADPLAEGSGVASCVGSGAVGTPVDTSTLGPQTFTVTAVDAAGNTGVRQVHYDVIASLPDSDGDGVDDVNEQDVFSKWVRSNGAWVRLSGDGNGDGVSDHVQPEVASFRSSTGLGWITLDLRSGGRFENVYAGGVLPEGSNQRDLGSFQFDVVGIVPGSRAVIDVRTQGTFDLSNWDKWTTDGLVQLPKSGDVYWASIGNRQTRLWLRDGGIGDLDGVANGRIVDPSIPEAELIVDETPPVTAASLSGSLGDNGWYTSAVTVDLLATDAVEVLGVVHEASGAETIAETFTEGDSASVTISADGTTALTYWSADVSLNDEEARVTDVRIDTTAPVVAAPAASPNPKSIDETALLEAGVSDATSGAVAAEWFIDTDPGEGDGVPMLIDAGVATGVIGTDLDPGVYTAYVRARDGAGNWSQPDETLLVVYDPDGGFVTGGGWIDSPAGALVADPDAEGRANFGFVSKYKNGATVPTGQTEFRFIAGDVNFHSTEYQWLVVSQGGTRAQFKGNGTINGDGDYHFMIWASDDDPDTFRIKLWTEDAGVETVVYDNGTDQAIGGGQIKVHTKK